MKEKEKKQLISEQSNRIKELIEELGINQTILSKDLSTSVQSVNAICNGKRQLTEGMAAKIGLKYGINPQWLLSGEGQKYNENQTSQLQKANQLKQIAALRATIQTALEQLEDLEKEVTK
jgi:plasmid maintenance system antidote protein VapI